MFRRKYKYRSSYAMDWLDYFLRALVLVLAVLTILTIVVAFTSPSCEDRGGKSVFSHLTPVFNGKTAVLVPVYDCVMPEEKP